MGVSRLELLGFPFTLQLRGPFGFIVRAGLPAIASCFLAAVRGVLVLFDVFQVLGAIIRRMEDLSMVFVQLKRRSLDKSDRTGRIISGASQFLFHVNKRKNDPKRSPFA